MGKFRLFLLQESRVSDIGIIPHTIFVRRIIHTATLSLLLQGLALSQLNFFENGQATRKGADAALFPDTQTRIKIDLAGEWRYSTDGKEWNNVSVPSAYDGVHRVTFMRTFEIKDEWIDRYAFSLVSYGINYQGEIAVNGSFVGRHVGGYTSFVFPIPQNMLQVGGENAIKISVENQLNSTSTLPIHSGVAGCRTYGGIFRDIYLLATPKLLIERPRVVSTISPDGKSAAITVGCDVTDRGWDGQTAPLAVQFELYDKLTQALALRSAPVPVTPARNRSVGITVKGTLANPKLWSPEVPDLYVLKCMIVRPQTGGPLVLDEADLDVGITDVRWADNHCYINNSLTLLKGVLWQEDHPSYGSAMTYSLIERDVALMKALGINLVRFLHPPHPYLLNLCDRYGILAMEEIPLDYVPGEILMREYYQDLAVSALKEMVNRDRNHVSVLAWGVGDELGTKSPSVCEYINTSRNIIHSLDGRPVYYASHRPDDRCFEYVDLVAAIAYETDAKGFREHLKQFQALAPSKPVIVARYGVSIEPLNRTGYSNPRSQEAQARMLMQCYDVMKELGIAGSVIWSFSDWRSDRPALTTHAADPYLQTMGLVSYEREKRIAFDVVRTVFSGEKVQALPIGNYASGSPVIYVLSGLVILISLAFLYNSNRRFRDCVNRSLFRTYNFFADIRDQHVITYAHSIFLAVVMAVAWATIFSSVMSHYRENLFLDNMLSQFLSDGIKSLFVKLVWSPPGLILAMTVLILVKIALLTLLIQACSVMVRTHVYFYHTFSITVWSMLPFVFLIPLSMLTYRMMESELYVIPVFVFLALITLWVILRLLKGVSIIYDVAPWKVYAAGLLLVVILGCGFYGYFEYTQSASVYVRYLVDNFERVM